MMKKWKVDLYLNSPILVFSIIIFALLLTPSLSHTQSARQIAQNAFPSVVLLIMEDANSQPVVWINCTAAFLIMSPINYSVAEQEKPKQQNELLQEVRKQKEQKKKEREEAIKRLEEKSKALMNYSIEELQLALTIKVIQKYQGAKIYSDEEEPKYLGTISDEFDAESIFNDFGRYGSEFSSESIWNRFGTYGSKFSPYSPFNNFSSSPPIIVKGGKIIGRLTVNKFVAGAVDPNWLKFYFTY